MKEKLIEKLRMYQEMRETVQNDTYGIEAKVEEYREALKRECEKNRAKKIEKIDTYLELLQSLIAEVEQEERDAECETQEAPIKEVDETQEEIKEEEV